MGLLELADATPQMSPDALVIEGVQLMTERNVGSIALTEGRKCVGMFTERDLMRRVVFGGKDVRTTPMRAVMTHPVITIPDAASVAQAAELMRSHHIRHLAIVDASGNLEGVVALRYLLYALMDDLEAKVGDLEGYLMADARGG